MNISKVAEHTAYIITEYYQNNITPFLEAFHEDALWIGPAQKQILRTRKAILEAFAQENHELRFCLHDLTILPLTVGSRQVCEIMVFLPCGHHLARRKLQPGPSAGPIYLVHGK